MTRSYTELRELGENFQARFQYLRLRGSVGADTFGFDRWINQAFYRSAEWRRVRDFVLVRDYGCDLGVPGYEVPSNMHIHHMNPMTVDDIKHSDPDILNPEFLISASQITHNAIHYGAAQTFQRVPEPRRQGDTQLW